jgi:hypothetical protein
LAKLAKQNYFNDVMLRLMQEVLTQELRPKETKQPGAGEDGRKNRVDQGSELSDCTFEKLDLRCKAETTVLKRILHFSMHV